MKNLKVTKKEKENYYPNNGLTTTTTPTTTLITTPTNNNSNLINSFSNNNNNIRQNINNYVDEVNVTIRRNEKGFGFEVSNGILITKVNQSMFICLIKRILLLFLLYLLI